MKLSPIQIIASATAAVVSAVLLSFLGDKGTIIGVALGSVFATLGSAAIGESLRRGHSKVKAVAASQQWRVPGIGVIAGDHEGPGTDEAGTTDTVQSSADASAHDAGTAVGNAAAAPPSPRSQPTAPSVPGETVRPLARYSSGARAPVPRVLGPPSGRPAAPRASMSAGQAVAGPRRGSRRDDGSVFGMRWGVLVAAILLVAALAVGVVLLIQAVSGQSLGHSLGGGGGPTPTTVPTTVPSTTVPRATTTTTVPRATTTTTTSPTTTTTTSPTTTTVPSAPSTTAPRSSGAATSGSPTTTTTTAPG